MKKYNKMAAARHRGCGRAMAARDVEAEAPLVAALATAARLQVPERQARTELS